MHLSNLENNLRRKALLSGGVPEDASQGDVGPEQLQAADQSVAQIMQPLAQAVQSGSKQQVASALAMVASQHPELFEKGKSAYRSEVSYSGIKRLMDPNEIMECVQNLRDSDKMDLVDKAKKMSALNLNGRVI